MIPDYETQEDRDNQLEIISIAAKKWRCYFEMSPAKCAYDASLFRNKDDSFASIVEAKWRGSEMDRYPDYMVSAEKYRELLNSAQTFRVPALLVVRFSDQIAWCDIEIAHNTPGAVRFGWGKRNQRGGVAIPTDRELMAFILNNQFKELKVGN